MRNAGQSLTLFFDGDTVAAGIAREVLSLGLIAIIGVLVLGLIAAGCGPPS